MSNEPKKHHYVQQSYLKGFDFPTKGKESKIVMYSKEHPLSHPKIVSIKDAACKKDLHTIKIQDKNDRRLIEEILSNLEGELITNIKDVISNENITDGNKVGLAMMILLMKSRVPQNLNAMHNHFKSTLETIAELNFMKNPMGLKGNFNDHFKLILHNNLPIYAMLTSVYNKSAINIICNMNFSLLKAFDNEYFLCSDAPVSYYCPNYTSGRGVGLAHAELEIFLPLNKKYGILCSHKALDKYRELNLDETIEYNRRTIVTSEKYIYSSSACLSINKLIDKHKSEFSGIKYYECIMGGGKLQLTSFIPVTDRR